MNKTISITLRTPLLLLAGLFAGAAQAADNDSARWTKTIEQVASAVVTIRVDATRPFDTEGNASAQATGFIVDAERGLILTNRHVVQPGPVIAEAIFQNKEEVALTPVYRDPVHDFGFYRFDPDALRYLEPMALPLAPENATVGREIRVIGNDAGEQLSILTGTIARMDRDAPEYGPGNYNDFNTFYIQAASGTSGGSSGSPVIDINGNAIALNAGARLDAASSFFLPLDRVVRALRLIQAGEPVTRGTLQTTFVFTPFDELRRLGLQPATEQAVRHAFPQQTGMLVVEQVVPGGPADGLLQVGDILTHVNGKLLTRFIPLETILDSNVGEQVTLRGERGGAPFEIVLRIQDLHSITPDRYLEISGGILHTLSYQMARHLNNVIAGVFVAHPGYMLSVAGVPRGAVLTEFEGHRLTTLDDLLPLLAKLPDGARASLRYYTFDQPQREMLALVEIGRHWFPANVCTRNDARGLWDCVPLPQAKGPVTREPVTAQIASYKDPRADRLAHSLVFVNFDMPYPIDGVDGAHYYGTGLVVDAERGLVVVDRNTVPVALGDVRLTFAGSLEIPARVAFIHPLHNLALLQYDPALLGNTPVQSAELNITPLTPGLPVWVVGLQPDQTLKSQGTQIASLDPARFPLSNTFRFRESNIELASLVNAPGDVDGVLADNEGRVVGLWSSFAYQSGRGLDQATRGMAAIYIRDMLRAVRTDQPLRSLEAEFYYMPMASARKLGLPAEWVDRLAALDNQARRVLAVERLVVGSPVAGQLQEGDLLLAVNGEALNSFRAVEEAAQADELTLTVFSQGKVKELRVPTVALDGRNTDRIVLWGGALLQAPHRAIAVQRGIPREGVFVAYFNYGSPANHYGLYPGRRIVAVDGQRQSAINSIATLRG